ncbi:MAG: hypothetical protein LBD86_01990 [Spirochaetaceae bacterium]|jgi:hypothetical protein|nr:hypothetical protein [Spirochaetaceae bacterium]
MKFRCLFVAAAVTSLFFVKAGQGFAQTPVRDIADDLNEFADDMAGALPFIASIGLGWSDSYIGHLVDITPHWGMGITTGATTLKLGKLNVLLDHFGYQADDGFMEKQLLPAYTVKVRIGGFRTLPFDIGVKWGWLPYLPRMLYLVIGVHSRQFAGFCRFSAASALAYHLVQDYTRRYGNV